MFDPRQIFPIVRASAKKGTDQEVMGALTQLAKAHPDLNEEQALAALQMYMKQVGQGPDQASALKSVDKKSLSGYLGGQR